MPYGKWSRVAGTILSGASVAQTCVWGLVFLVLEARVELLMCVHFATPEIRTPSLAPRMSGLIETVFCKLAVLERMMLSTCGGGATGIS